MQEKTANSQIYGFNTQLKIGEKNEKLLDLYFIKYYQIKPVSLDEQKKGIDRIFIDGDRMLKIEYKADYKAIKTGNVYIETYSVKPIKKGWAYTSKSDFVIYYIIGDAVYIMPIQLMREKLEIWKYYYKLANCKNHGYESEGILVPLGDIRRTFKRIEID